MLRTRDYRDAPVPVRMTCRFSNGIMLSYYARVITTSKSSIHLMSANPFEHGVQLNLVAPFLNGIVSCRVYRVRRSEIDRSLFDLELRVVKELGMEKDDEARLSPLSLEQLTETTGQLADQLEKSMETPFRKIIRNLPESERHPFLMASITAVSALMQEKGYLDLQHALLAVQEG